MEPLIYAFNGKSPQIDSSAFIAPGVVICGDVMIGPEASIWFGCIVRGDTNRIEIGARSNVQDGSILHVDAPEAGGKPLTIGKEALVGHRCMLHGCCIDDGGFVGMASTMLDGSCVETGGFLAAGAVLGPGKIVRTGEMWGGLPAKKMRALQANEDKYALLGAKHYVDMSRQHADALTL